MTSFAHANWTYDNNAILTIRLSAPFGEGTIRDAGQALDESRHARKEGQYVTIVVVESSFPDDLMLFLRLLDALMELVVQEGVRGKGLAIVADASITGSKWIRPALHETLIPITDDFGLFNNEDQATVWARGRLASKAPAPSLLPVSIQGKVMRYTIKGELTNAMLIEFGKTMLASTPKRRELRHYGVLLDMTQLQVPRFVGRVTSGFAVMINGLRSSGLIGTSLIAGLCPIRTEDKIHFFNIIEDVFADCGFSFRLFDNEFEATQWIRESVLQQMHREIVGASDGEPGWPVPHLD